MKEQKTREWMVKTGRELLDTGLVARTWGNISCRCGEQDFLITPSGLDYTRTQPEDIVKVSLLTGEWEGRRKPSSERGVHSIAYQMFPEVQYVIHTHQIFATAFGIAGFEELVLTQEQRLQLGGIALAKYGLPGSEKLVQEVKKAMESGAQTILMAHHGALLCARTGEEALQKAFLLEEICRQSISSEEKSRMAREKEALLCPEGEKLLEELRKVFPCVEVVNTAPVYSWAEEGKDLRAQVDDMAQMIGLIIGAVPLKKAAVLRILRKKSAVFVPGVGAIVRGNTQDDVTALALLVEKAVICAMRAAHCKVKAELSLNDVAKMRNMYVRQYAQQKEG